MGSGRERKREKSSSLIMRVLQRESNAALLAVCPPPYVYQYQTTNIHHMDRRSCHAYTHIWVSKTDREVDRMPISSVQNALPNPHEINQRVAYSPPANSNKSRRGGVPAGEEQKWRSRLRYTYICALAGVGVGFIGKEGQLGVYLCSRTGAH